MIVEEPVYRICFCCGRCREGRRLKNQGGYHICADDPGCREMLVKFKAAKQERREAKRVSHGRQ